MDWPLWGGGRRWLGFRDGGGRPRSMNGETEGGGELRGNNVSV